MIKKISLRLLLLTVAASVFVCLPAHGQVPAAPRAARLVNDLAGVFTSQQAQALEDSLVAFDRATSTQIVVVTLPDLGAYAPSQMAFAIMDQWGVGQKEKNNGVVMLIKPRNAEGKGEVFIATGLGLEGVLPDGRVTRMIDNVMIPHLKRGDYFAASWDGAQALRDMTRGEYTAEQKDARWQMWTTIIGFVIFVIFIILAVVANGKSKKNGDPNDPNNQGGGGSSLPLWLLLGSLLNSGGGRGGRGGGSGGGFGGFGGFGGGGSFGGGGGRSF